MKISNIKNGFTLIELLVVIGIIGLITSIATASLNNARVNARDAMRKNDLRTIKNALELYYADNGIYPQAGSCTYGEAPCYVNSATTTQPWIPGLEVYIKKLPVDPINKITNPSYSNRNENQFYLTNIYIYGNLSANGNTYDLAVTKLENTSDSDRCEVKKYKYISNTVLKNSLWCDNTQLYYIYSKYMFTN
jgi:type II secretion system protein G